jgi:quaternary ammonium compound-resistance protein SugE
MDKTTREREVLVMSPWLLLVLAGLFEVVWAVGLKYTEGFTRPGPTALVAVTLTASMWLLARAARDLPIGTAYAVWVGIGAVGAAICGIVLFREPVTLARLGFLALLIVALLGLKLTAGEH